MQLTQLITLSLCCWSAAGRSYWSDVPELVFSNDEVKKGETVEVSCLLPNYFTGGQCRLYKGDSTYPFREMTVTSYECSFTLTSKELRGKERAGSVVRLWCDYHFQHFTSKASDRRVLVVWGSRPSPTLSVSHRFLSPEDEVEVNCSAPRHLASSCRFLRDDEYISVGSCTKNLTGKDLGIWTKPTLLLPVNLSCVYDPNPDRYIRSTPSNHEMLFVVDPSRVASSIDCKVSVNEVQLEAFESKSWTAVGSNGTTVTVNVTNSNLTLSEMCGFTESE